MKATNVFVAAAVCACAGSALGDIYHTLTQLENDFEIVQINPFDGLASGALGQLEFSSGAYSYTIETINQDGSSPASGGLFNYNGYLSTESATDGILITFTGADVYAVAGNMWAVDGQGANTGGYLTIESDDGQSAIFSSTGPENFRGLSSAAPIRTLFVEMPGEELWVALDNLVIGTVPSPSALALLGLGGMLAGKRRR